MKTAAKNAVNGFRINRYIMECKLKNFSGYNAESKRINRKIIK